MWEIRLGWEHLAWGGNLNAVDPANEIIIIIYIYKYKTKKQNKKDLQPRITITRSRTNFFFSDQRITEQIYNERYKYNHDNAEQYQISARISLTKNSTYI